MEHDGHSSSAPRPDSGVTLTYQGADGQLRRLLLDAPCCIGRGAEADLQIEDSALSRRHAEVYPAGGGWWVRDLGSTNATYVDGVKILNHRLENGSTIRFAEDGPEVSVHLAGSPSIPAPAVVRAPVAHQTFVAPSVVTPAPRANDAAPGLTGTGSSASATTGALEQEQARLRGAYQRALANSSTRQTRVVTALCTVIVLLASVAGYQFFVLQSTKEDAVRLFYEMKTVEREMQTLKREVGESASLAANAEITKLQSKLSALRDTYDRESIKHRELPTGSDREYELILEVARIFGECDLEAPPGFVAKVREYIREWQGSKRLANAIARAKKNGHLDLIVRELARQDLAPQFLYVALQESNFNVRAVGPKTRFGIAKGAWQIIPSTAKDLGLRVGRLYDKRTFDGGDDRFNMKLATDAAARYIRTIYDGAAEGSGLLTMASYNWGPHRIKKRLKTLPKDPQSRNFWELLRRHDDVPDETYHYVFRIVAAAVIGEDPAFFGFEFAKPLSGIRLTSERHLDGPMRLENANNQHQQVGPPVSRSGNAL